MIDSHAHTLAEQFNEDRDAVITRAKEAGIRWIEIGTNLADSKKALEYPHASVGVHPNDLAVLRDSDWEELEQLLAHKNVCAVGEVGLDFSRFASPKSEGRRRELDLQEAALKKFIALAQQKNLPMIFHVRSGHEIDAHDELIRILQHYSDADRPRGVIHTFSGTLDQANAYIALGMMISFSGVITFKNAGELREIAKAIPLDRMLVETDCPFLTPEPHRGKRNEMVYVRYVIQKIAEVRGVSFAAIEQVTEANANKLFALDI